MADTKIQKQICITSRVDDVINVSGFRLSKAEMEEMVSLHPSLAECAVIRINDELKGQIPLVIIVLKLDVDAQYFQFQYQIVQLVRNQLGEVASLRDVAISSRLPKTRSVKILRKTTRSIAYSESFQISSTIDDENILKELEIDFKAFKVVLFKKY